MRLVIHRNHEEAGLWAALYISDKINAHNKTMERPFILGLPTGGTSSQVYLNLVRLYKEGKLSFANVHTFNMDEYLGLPADHPQSYHYFMAENLFNHVDIDLKNVNILDGMAQDPDLECRFFEKAISKAGGIDLFLGGMGSNGHIAFNEPGSSMQSRTRVKTLTEEIRIANARFFENDPARVPAKAMTVGVGTVMDAREVMIIATGKNKARALQKVIENGINHMWTVSCLQMHPRALIVCDEDAVEELKTKTVRYFMDIEKETIKSFNDTINNR